MQYATRRLVTLQGMRYEGRVMEPGETFEATEVDARYFMQHRMCDAAPEEPPAPVEAEVKPRRGRPPKVVAETPAESTTAPVEDSPAVPAVMTLADAPIEGQGE